MSAIETTVVTAPGKVLIAGGYLVLDKKFFGIVVGTDAKFYSFISTNKFEKLNDKFLIKVKSPQFTDGFWDYMVKICHIEKDEFFFQLLPISSEQKSNKFIESAIIYSLNVAAKLQGKKIINDLEKGLHIIIVGSNDFYSQRQRLSELLLPLTTKSLKSLERFCSTNSKLAEVHKTGLGSSAALITSLVGGILSHLKVVNLKSPEAKNYGRELIHSISQFCHCLAQGKIGSGFDISAAIYGSHTYRRFSKSIIENHLNSALTMDRFNKETNSNFTSLLQKLNPKNSCFDNEIHPFSLPPGFILKLADLDVGSSTPKLVSNVLKWRANKPDEANELWESLNIKNTELENLFRKLLTQFDGDAVAYKKILKICSGNKAALWKKNIDDITSKSEKVIFESFCLVYETFQSIRQKLQEMTLKAEVPIEPLSQTKLLNSCMEVEGIIMAGVPGAGGFDAIFVIGLSEKAVAKVEDEVWLLWKDTSVGPLTCTTCSTGIECLSEEEGGLLLEYVETLM
ncbi:phosphomevalonate kinase [Clydaea vesicula]|uniref:Phosphomevalonate kinase n=1 Tax=Clydaea vesicula TaxID=447962 RepID=A0AAD5U7B9_9FUNG|nr:phosphomevalonate kinase [Clydaea vesicula]KAJ3392482.1 phosphomevalonate kinase [Lobulomyces angularis]